MPAPCVFTHLTVQRGRKARTVLRDVSGEVPSGSVMALVGPNGSGKSTLLESLVGLHPLSAGAIAWHASNRPVAFQRAISLQTSGLPRQRRVDDFLHVIGQLYDSPRTAQQACQAVGLDIAGNVRIKALSAGQAHRVRVAAAWISAAPVLLLDEPTSGVDVGSAEAIRTLIRSHADDGGAVLLVTHLRDDVHMADAVCSLRDGHLGPALPRHSWPQSELRFTMNIPHDVLMSVVPAHHELTRRDDVWSIVGPGAHAPELIASVTSLAFSQGATVGQWSTTNSEDWWESLMGPGV